MKKEKTRAIIIGIILITYFIIIFIACIPLGIIEPISAILISLIVTILIGCIYQVMKERIMELSEEEKNDYSKY